MKGLSITGFCLSLVSLVFGILPGLFSGWAAIIGLPVAIVGLCLSVSGGRKCKAAGVKSGLATAGMVIGIIATVFTAITFVTCGLCVLLCKGAEAGAKAALSK
ncbi:MAG: hypothetical protein E7678_08305 [Ruminococcaceae bacterium]|nr:hypothetical protein [Oscillospiraceae bacterium]